MNKFANVLALNDTFIKEVNDRADRCGYTKFLQEALTFPPAGKFTAPNMSAPGLSFLNLSLYNSSKSDGVQAATSGTI